MDEPRRHSTCPAEPNISAEKIWQTPNLFDLWAMSEKMIFRWRNIFSGVVNTAFHMICSAEKNFKTNGLFSKKNMFDILFWFWMKKFRICGRSFQQGCQKQNPRDQRNFLVKLYLEEDTTLSFDGFSQENLICKKTQCSSVRHSSCPVEHSKGQISWRNKTFRTFGHWARIFWVSGQRSLAKLPKLLSMWPEQLSD